MAIIGWLSLLSLITLRSMISTASPLTLPSVGSFNVSSIDTNASSLILIPSDLKPFNHSHSNGIQKSTGILASFDDDIEVTPAERQQIWEHLWRTLNVHFLPALVAIPDTQVSRTSLLAFGFTIEMNYQGIIQGVFAVSAIAADPEITMRKVWRIYAELIGEMREGWTIINEPVPAANELYNWDDLKYLKVFMPDAALKWHAILEEKDIPYRGRAQTLDIVSLKVMPDGSDNKQYFWRFQYKKYEYLVGTQYGDWLYEHLDPS